MENDKLKTEETFTKEDLEKAFNAGRQCHSDNETVDDEEYFFDYDNFEEWFKDK